MPYPTLRLLVNREEYSHFMPLLDEEPAQSDVDSQLTYGDSPARRDAYAQMYALVWACACSSSNPDLSNTEREAQIAAASLAIAALLETWRPIVAP